VAPVVRVCGMRTGIIVEVNAADRVLLEAVVADRNSPQKHVWRARIVLLSAGGCGTHEIMRPSRIPPLGEEVTERVVALTWTDPPGETTHWTAAAMAGASGISVSSVQRIWRSHGLQPHRVRQFKLANDPHFVAKVRDVVGLYVDAPAQPSCSRWTRRARYRHLPAPSAACR
jgi:hypothetical protein